MNKLSLHKRVQILSMLVEGSSMRSISRVADVSINSVTKLLEDAGVVCATYHRDHVRGVRSQRIQCDEIWSFCYSKARNVSAAKRAPYGAGDVWTWTAIDADSKLMVSWLVGLRDSSFAIEFIADLRDRLANKVQLTTDGNNSYLRAVEETNFDADYAMLIKLYGDPPEETERRYSPQVCTGVRTRHVMGAPQRAHVSTSFVERHNLQMRMSMKRFARLTNAHSKKLANHSHALALYFMYYNWIRQHASLRVSPAMAAGLTDKLMTFEDIVALMDAQEGPPKKRGPYKKRLAANRDST
jgi:IS1 family transposase